ncbi:MAG: DUF86 domain-containing protein [Candidatus Paceibacterota bacterium]
MKRDQKLFITDIYESIVLIEKYLGKMKFEDFSIDFAIRDAVAMRFAIIGEAAKKVSSALRGKHKDIPWKYMCGLRDMIIHEYFGIDGKKVWKTAKEDLPRLKIQIKAVLGEINKEKLGKN